MDLLSGIINTILGPDTKQMNESDRKKTEAAQQENRDKASGYAFNASKNPGMQFMRPETSVGTGASLSDIIQMAMKIFGAGGG